MESYGQSLQYAMGSATELDYHLLLAHDLGFLDPGTYAARLEDATRIQKMLSSFIVKLRPAAALLVTARSTNGQ